MQTKKCSECNFTNWSSADFCKRCKSSYFISSEKAKPTPSQNNKSIIDYTNQELAVLTETGDLNKDAWRKIKWGGAISFVGFTLTIFSINFGLFEGYTNTEKIYIKLVRVFSLITLLPLSAVLAGMLELVTGISIFQIIEKWEELPHWLSWLIGIGAFLLVITIIMVIAAVIIFNFF